MYRLFCCYPGDPRTEGIFPWAWETKAIQSYLRSAFTPADNRSTHAWMEQNFSRAYTPVSTPKYFDMYRYPITPAFFHY